MGRVMPPFSASRAQSPPSGFLGQRPLQDPQRPWPHKTSGRAGIQLLRRGGVFPAGWTPAEFSEKECGGRAAGAFLQSLHPERCLPTASAAGLPWDSPVLEAAFQLLAQAGLGFSSAKSGALPSSTSAPAQLHSHWRGGGEPVGRWRLPPDGTLSGCSIRTAARRGAARPALPPLTAQPGPKRRGWGRPKRGLRLAGTPLAPWRRPRKARP